jgi:malate permease and related proteins
MREFLFVLFAVMPVFCVALSGFVMRRLNWLSSEADESLLKMTINILAPCLIFMSIINNQALKQVETLLIAPVVGFGTVAIGMMVALLFCKITSFCDNKTIGTFALCVGLYNYSYVPVPLAQTLFSSETVGVLFVNNFGVEVAMWTLGLWLLRGRDSGQGWKQLFNPPLLAVVVGVIANLINLNRYLPEFILKVANMFGQCAIPIGLLLIGAIIADQAGEFYSVHGWSTIINGCLLKVGIVPVILLLIAKIVPCSIELKRVIILQAAMPSAVFPIIMARHFGGDVPTALRVVIGTAIISLVTIPFWLRLGMQIIGQ